MLAVGEPRLVVLKNGLRLFVDQDSTYYLGDVVYSKTFMDSINKVNTAFYLLGESYDEVSSGQEGIERRYYTGYNILNWFCFMKNFLYIIITLCCLSLGACSSDDDNSYMITVASKRASYFDPEYNKESPIFLYKDNLNSSWKATFIDHLDYTPGYEYTIEVKPTGFRTEYEGFVCLKIISKKIKSSEGLPPDLYDK